MTPEQIKEERSRLGFTGAQMAERIGVTPRAYAYYEAGQRAIPLPVQKLIKLQRETERAGK